MNRSEPAKASLRLESDRAVFSGRWTARHIGRVGHQIEHTAWPAGKLTFELSEVERMDTAGAWLLHRLQRQLTSKGMSVELEGVTPEMQGLLKLVSESGVMASDLPRPERTGALQNLGQTSLRSLQSAMGLIAFVGEAWLAGIRLMLHPGRIRWAEIAHSLGEAGHKALPIVGLLAFLLGIVITYQGGVQLRQYGASIFVADLVGLSMLRELAPIMTAIIVAGRTGSAYTAQIGTMQVTEEVDALRSIGIQPMELLVLPKLLALMIALPLLTLYADVMGVLGGMVMAKVQLDISYATFIDRLQVALTVKSYLVGIGKAPVFAAMIAIIGCYQGFKVSGSAASVGRHTTISVVHAILAVIVVDALFSVAFSYLDI